ncbi:MAG: hypothetical protein WBL02_06630 [Methanomethylovorans sp.]|nr:hypothetical protein [Methanomethylovorans sp.]
MSSFGVSFNGPVYKTPLSERKKRYLLVLADTTDQKHKHAV